MPLFTSFLFHTGFPPAGGGGGLAGGLVCKPPGPPNTRVLRDSGSGGMAPTLGGSIRT